MSVGRGRVPGARLARPPDWPCHPPPPAARPAPAQHRWPAASRRASGSAAHATGRRRPNKWRPKWPISGAPAHFLLVAVGTRTRVIPFLINAKGRRRIRSAARARPASNASETPLAGRAAPPCAPLCASMRLMRPHAPHAPHAPPCSLSYRRQRSNANARRRKSWFCLFARPSAGVRQAAPNLSRVLAARRQTPDQLNCAAASH